MAYATVVAVGKLFKGWDYHETLYSLVRGESPRLGYGYRIGVQAQPVAVGRILRLSVRQGRPGFPRPLLRSMSGRRTKQSLRA